MNNKVIYTAVFGGVDEVIAPEEITHGCDHIFFGTDLPATAAEPWVWLPTNCDEPVGNILNARIHKIRGGLEFLNVYSQNRYRYFVWVDANIRIRKDLTPLFDILDEPGQRAPILMFPHPVRNCVYKEAHTCVQLKRDDPTKIKLQMHEYTKLGLPVNTGLLETGVMIFRNDLQLSQFMSIWMAHVYAYSIRDQLSFNFLRWFYNLSVYHLPGGIRNSEYFELLPHKKRNDGERLHG